MHFRLGFIIRDFEFGDAQIRVSDQAKQIDVLISKRPADETHPTWEPKQGLATATCQREIPARHREEAVSSGDLSRRREAVGQVHRELSTLILHTLRLVRWRANSPGGPNPIQFGAEFSWSLDGRIWKPVADNIFFKVELSISPRWTNETEEFVRKEVLRELDELLGHELLREAAVNRKDNLRSSLILAVVAAEVGFKQFASKALPDADWILDKLPSPPLETMLKAFPWPRLGVQINGKVPSIPDSIQSELKKAILLRNQIVHTGGPVTLKVETVDSVLTSVRDLLYFLDALQGQTWAATHISRAALKSFSKP
jgi:hypothetical protein